MVQIVWCSNILDFTGYGKASRQYVMALHSFGIDVKVEPILLNLPQVELPPDQSAVLLHLMGKPKSRSQKVYIMHQTPDSWRRRIYPTIGFTYWETSKIPEHWVNQSHQMNAVFVPSHHNHEVFYHSGVRVPLFHIRPCLSPSAFHPAVEQPPNYLQQLPPFRFLSVMSWIERKGYDLLLKAFWEEFTAADNVAMVIKTDGPESILNEIEGLKSNLGISHQTSPVYVDFQVRSENEMDALYRNCQVYVHPSRGEGAGYPVLEAAAKGLPIITTGWGGQMDFINEQTGYLIPYSLVPVKPQAYYHGYHSDQLWAEASKEELRKIMRNVYENYQQAVLKGAAAQHYVRHNFTHEQAAQDIVTAIQQLTGWRLK